MKNILLTGGGGQLGRAFRKISGAYPNLHITYTTRQSLDINNAAAVSAFLDGGQFDALVNCAAFTAVDKAETEKETAQEINHTAVSQLAKIAAQNDVFLIHIGTDFVFDGDFAGKNPRPYTEDDSPSPLSVYGQTKLNGELAVLATGGRALVIRTSWLYSEFGNNFARTMWKLGQKQPLRVVDDQFGSPTYAPDLSAAILSILQSSKLATFSGAALYHYCNHGAVCWHDFARDILKLGNIACSLSAIGSAEYAAAAKRPRYSVLDATRIQNDFGVEIKPYAESLKECVSNMADLPCR